MAQIQGTTDRKQIENELKASEERFHTSFEYAAIEMAMEKFGQVRRKKGINNEGTGLSLPLVKSLVKSHGGKLVLNSIVGEGTTASVSTRSERVVNWTHFITQSYVRLWLRLLKNSLLGNWHENYCALNVLMHS